MKDAFDGKMVDQKGQSVDLMNKIVNRAINADLLVNTENEIIGVNCYGDVKGIRYLGWFNGANLNKDELPIEMFKVACPFVGPFKVFHVNDRYYFVTTRGILYSSLIDKDGKPLEILPVFLGFGEPVNAVISVVDSKRVYVFTRNRYFELKNSIPSPKQLRKLPLISYLKSPWITVELSDRSLSLCRRLIDDKIIEPIKVDVK